MKVIQGRQDKTEVINDLLSTSPRQGVSLDIDKGDGRTDKMFVLIIILLPDVTVGESNGSIIQVFWPVMQYLF